VWSLLNSCPSSTSVADLTPQKEDHAEKGGVDAVNVAAFAYDIYTAPPHHNGVLGSTLTAIPHHRFFELRKLKKTVQRGWKRLLCHATTCLVGI
jgi:uncharacterized protein (UPF0248 family)